MGLGVDPKFDDLLQSLGKIAQKHSRPVLDSILRWRRSQNENVAPHIISIHIGSATQRGASSGHLPSEVPLLLNERKSLASIYIMCRALNAVLQTLSKDALSEAMGHSLEETTFEQFRKPDFKSLVVSPNHRANAELFATLLGHLSNIRFVHRCQD